MILKISQTFIHEFQALHSAVALAHPGVNARFAPLSFLHQTATAAVFLAGGLSKSTTSPTSYIRLGTAGSSGFFFVNQANQQLPFRLRQYRSTSSLVTPLGIDAAALLPELRMTGLADDRNFVSTYVPQATAGFTHAGRAILASDIVVPPASVAPVLALRPFHVHPNGFAQPGPPPVTVPSNLSFSLEHNIDYVVEFDSATIATAAQQSSAIWLIAARPLRVGTVAVVPDPLSGISICAKTAGAPTTVKVHGIPIGIQSRTGGANLGVETISDVVSAGPTNPTEVQIYTVSPSTLLDSPWVSQQQ